MKYLEEVQKGMDLLAAQPNSIFVGQAVEYKGTSLTHQVKNYEKDKLLELPVAEDFQAGFCIGLALQGYLPICLYPRMNFALLAANQIINHLDKWDVMSTDDQEPKVIIKAVVGSQYPLDPGHQHKANFVQAFRSMCSNIRVVDLLYPNEILAEYRQALEREQSTLLVEHGDLY